jgi:hypothetical protein
MGSPQDAALRHRLSSIRAVIQSFENILTTASPFAKPDLELLIRFFNDAEKNAKNEIELHELTHDGIEARKRACASPERYITNAPKPPSSIFNRTPPQRPPQPRRSREEQIASKKAELESELRKAEERSSELKKIIDDWYSHTFPEWEKVTADARSRWTDRQQLAIEQYGALKLHHEQTLGSQTFQRSENREDRGRVLTIEQVHTVALSSTWKQLQSRFRDVRAKAPGQLFSGSFLQTESQSGSDSGEWIVRGDPVCRTEFDHLSTIAARKLGYAASEDGNKYWLDRVRKWMQQTGLDKDRKVARYFTVNSRGNIGKIESLYTEHIPDLSAMFCENLITRGTPESAASLPSERSATVFSTAAIAAAAKKGGGRKPTRDPKFCALAETLWKKEQASARTVKADGLKRIAEQLEASGFAKPADYLERDAAKSLNAHNRQFGASEARRVMTWTALVERGDKDQIRAMRKLLYRCARNVRE